MTLENIRQVKSTSTEKEANELLSRGNWRLLETKIEKLKIPVGKERVEHSTGTTIFHADSEKYEIKYEEQLKALYILGKI